MPVRTRLFVSAPLAEGQDLELEGAQAHYLLDVMRSRAGDLISIFNGRDGEWQAVLVHAAKRRLILRIQEVLRAQEPEPGPCLYFAPLKRTRLDMMVEKAIELGVAALVPVQTRRTVVDRINEARLTAIAIEAAEQCGRLTLPSIAPMRTLASLLESWPFDGVLFVADESRTNEPLLQALQQGGAGAVLIGPEGGFDAIERAAFEAHPGIRPVSLGPRILRAETAAITALALWQAVCGSESQKPQGG